MSRLKLLLPLGICALAACAAPKVHQSPGASVLDPASRDISTGQIAVTDIDMTQIGSAPTGGVQDQIGSLSAGDSITAEQLRTYVDRCAPGASLPPAPGTNCDEIRLMVKRRFRDDDEVYRTLNVLENLGRGSEADALLNRSGVPGQLLPPDVLQGGAPAPGPAGSELVPEDAATQGLPPGVMLEQSGG